MSRVKKGLSARKHRKYLLVRAKGYLGAGSKKFRYAKERLLKADSNSYISRKLRKRDFRSLWITRINGALDQIQSELNYSRFMNLLSKSEYKELNRKMLSELAIQDIESFKEIVNKVSKVA